MSIQNELDKIKNAVYGKEVRGAIHDGIKKAYDDASLNGNANMEVEMAKGRYPTLNGRLEHLDQETVSLNHQLAEKVSKGTKANLEDLSPSVLAAIDGTGGPFNLLSIPQNKSVGYEKTNFLNTGKNRFDKTTRSKGMFIEETNGALTSDLGTGYDSSAFIPVYAGVTYHLNKIRTYALYNKTHMYLSGYRNANYNNSGMDTVTFKPVEDGYVRFSFGSNFSDVVQLEAGTSFTGYEPFYYEVEKLRTNELGEGIVTDKNIAIDSNIVIKKAGKNKINLSNAKLNFYVDYTTGLHFPNNDNKVVSVALVPNTTYTISNQSPEDAKKTISQLAFFNNKGVYISGLSNSGVSKSLTIQTGPDVYRLDLTVPKAITSGMMLEKGATVSPYEPFKKVIPIDDLPNISGAEKHNVLVVKSSGGDYTNLRDAVDSITNANATNTYTIELHEGLYDIFSYYSNSEKNSPSFDGLRLPNYVSLKGIGDKKKIILQGFLPDDEVDISFQSHGRISTLCPLGNGDIENVTIAGKNLRYCVHDDYDYPNARKKMINCDFIRYKGNGRNYGGKQAWGEGSWSGQSFYFEDCNFFTEWDYYAYTSHNNYDFSTPSYHKFVNCKFFTTMGSASVRFESLGSKQEEPVFLIGCRMNAGVELTCHSSNTIGVLDHYLNGYGNDTVPVVFLNKNDATYTYEFADETQELFNATGTLISKGMPVMNNSAGISIVHLTGNDNTRFIGVALEDIPSGKSGVIQKRGYLSTKTAGLTELSIGDRVGILNGALSKVVSNEYVGVVLTTGFIKLK